MRNIMRQPGTDPVLSQSVTESPTFDVDGDFTVYVPTVYNGENTVFDGASLTLKVGTDVEDYEAYQGSSGLVITETEMGVQYVVKCPGRARFRFDVTDAGASTSIPAIMVNP